MFSRNFIIQNWIEINARPLPHSPALYLQLPAERSIRLVILYIIHLL
jgi:hypothetical protein